LTASLARDHRAAADVGRRARLELVFACRNGRTILAHAYAEPPFRVGRWFAEGDGLHMVMVASAPGIFSGDSFEQVIRIERGARVRLTSQSALQVHPSGAGGSRGVRRKPDGAEICSSYHVADAASLHCQWDPVIPFAGARFEQRIDIQLAPTAHLFWSDAYMAGRAFADRTAVGLGGGANEVTGERWAFTSLGHELRISREKILEYLERYRIVPTERNVAHPWAAGEACYFGTLIRSGVATSLADAERLHAELASRKGVRAATDAVSPTLWITRALATRGVPFHAVRQLVTANMRL